jgi:hypothetical protein
MAMDGITVLPNKEITAGAEISDRFLALGIDSFHSACRYVHELPYGYNSDRDELMILFKENMGTCTTKHAVIATLAAELSLPVAKHVGIYAMTEQIATGTNEILEAFGLPYVPMLHCFLVSGDRRVDLTEGNRNGKNCAIDEFLITAPVDPNISAKNEYLLYREALTSKIWINTQPRRKKKTLVVVVADHETGGYALNGPYGTLAEQGEMVEDAWTFPLGSAGHTATDVLIWAQGPAIRDFGQALDNADNSMSRGVFISM